MHSLNRFSSPRQPLIALALLMATLAPGSAQASGPDPESSAWGLGLGAISMQKPYKGMDRDNKAVPMIYFENEWLRVFGPGLELKLPEFEIDGSQRIEFSLLTRYDGSGYKAKDSSFLSGMAKRKNGVWVGGKASWKNEFAELTAEWAADASGASKGQRFELGLEKDFRFGQRVMLTPRLSASWLDKKYVDYYYGVRAAEASAGRAAYAGTGTMNAEVGLRTMYMFDRKQSLFLDLGVKALGQEIKDSPLVDRRQENRVFLGYLYRY